MLTVLWCSTLAGLKNWGRSAFPWVSPTVIHIQPLSGLAFNDLQARRIWIWITPGGTRGMDVVFLYNPEGHSRQLKELLAYISIIYIISDVLQWIILSYFWLDPKVPKSQGFWKIWLKSAFQELNKTRPYSILTINRISARLCFVLNAPYISISGANFSKASPKLNLLSLYNQSFKPLGWRLCPEGVEHWLLRR